MRIIAGYAFNKEGMGISSGYIARKQFFVCTLFPKNSNVFQSKFLTATLRRGRPPRLRFKTFFARAFSLSRFAGSSTVGFIVAQSLVHRDSVSTHPPEHNIDGDDPAFVRESRLGAASP